MGWANCGTDSKGRPRGYAVEAVCDYPDCEAIIDRGLSYACGGQHGEDEYSCEGYFCPSHMMPAEDDNGKGLWLCAECAKLLEQFRKDEQGDNNVSEQESLAEKKIFEQVGIPSLTPEEIERILDSRVFVLVEGGSFPSQSDAHGLPVVLAPPQPGAPECWFETLEQLPEPPAACVVGTHRPRFRVAHEVFVGTIDELVNSYRERLTKALTTMVQYGGYLAHQDTAGTLKQAMELGYMPGKALQMSPTRLGAPATVTWLKKAATCMQLWLEQYFPSEGEKLGTKDEEVT